MTEGNSVEDWKRRALYEEAEKLAMETRIAELLSHTGRWFTTRLPPTGDVDAGES